MVLLDDIMILQKAVLEKDTASGYHKHPGRMYSHPAGQTHPALGITGPHPGIDENKEYWNAFDQYSKVTQKPKEQPEKDILKNPVVEKLGKEHYDYLKNLGVDVDSLVFKETAGKNLVFVDPKGHQFVFDVNQSQKWFDFDHVTGNYNLGKPGQKKIDEHQKLIESFPELSEVFVGELPQGYSFSDFQPYAVYDDKGFYWVSVDKKYVISKHGSTFAGLSPSKFDTFSGPGAVLSGHYPKTQYVKWLDDEKKETSDEDKKSFALLQLDKDRETLEGHGLDPDGASYVASPGNKHLFNLVDGTGLVYDSDDHEWGIETFPDSGTFKILGEKEEKESAKASASEEISWPKINVYSKKNKAANEALESSGITTIPASDFSPAFVDTKTWTYWFKPPLGGEVKDYLVYVEENEVFEVRSHEAAVSALSQGTEKGTIKYWATQQPTIADDSGVWKNDNWDIKPPEWWLEENGVDPSDGLSWDDNLKNWNYWNDQKQIWDYVPNTLPITPGAKPKKEAKVVFPDLGEINSAKVLSEMASAGYSISDFKPIGYSDNGKDDDLYAWESNDEEFFIFQNKHGKWRMEKAGAFHSPEEWPGWKKADSSETITSTDTTIPKVKVQFPSLFNEKVQDALKGTEYSANDFVPASYHKGVSTGKTHYFISKDGKKYLSIDINGNWQLSKVYGPVSDFPEIWEKVSEGDVAVSSPKLSASQMTDKDWDDAFQSNKKFFYDNGGWFVNGYKFFGIQDGKAIFAQNANHAKDLYDVFLYDTKTNEWRYTAAANNHVGYLDIAGGKKIESKPPKKANEEEYTKLSGQKGSTEGGLYKHNKTDKQFYIKFPGQARATVENLASMLYKLAGVPVADTQIMEFQGDKYAISSSWIDGAQPMSVSAMKKHQDVLDNFAIDAWLANWDTIGTDYDNIVLGPDGKAYRIDPGGSLTFRAMGGTKDFAKDTVFELKSLRDSYANSRSADVFGEISDEHLKKGAYKLSQVSDKMIDKTVDASHLTAKEKAFFKDTLKGRRDYIVQTILGPEAHIKGRREKKPCPPGFHRHGPMENHAAQNYLECHPETQKHRIKTMKYGKGDAMKWLQTSKNKEARRVVQLALEYREWKGERTQYDIENFARSAGLENETDHMQGQLSSWQSGGTRGQTQIRAAIAELKGEAETKYATEFAYFVYVQGDSPDEFERRYQEGRKNAIGLIPFIAKTQEILKKRHEDKYIPDVYRGMTGEVAKTIKSAVQRTKNPEAVFSIPNDGISGFTTSKSTAQSFGHGGVVLKKRRIPISKVWIDFNTFSESFIEEREFMIDSEAVTLFRKDEIDFPS